MRPVAILAGMISALALSGLCCAHAASGWAGRKPANAEMQAIFEADQAARSGSAAVDFSKISKSDSDRRARVLALLNAGQLKTGADFRAAAFIFQHGTKSKDYLFAHILAMIAVQKGDAEAQWIAAATLDRFLMTSGHEQVFGTQFAQQDGPDKPFTQRPYDKDLVSDSLRTMLGVRTLAEQQDYLAELERERTK